MPLKTHEFNKRQDAILAFIEEAGTVSIGHIIEYIRQTMGAVTRITVSRDLEKILAAGLIQRKGAGRGVHYEMSVHYAIVKPIDVEQYFSVESDQREAPGHSREEAAMILNHKKALEYIGENSQDFQSVSLRKIENIHSLLMGGLGVAKNLRKTLVRITGKKYAPLDNEFQIREALEKTCQLVNETEDVFEKAVMLMLLIAYIQPFVDGNKRTSRLAGNAILQSFDASPLSYRSMEDIEYKKAILLFYEQNNVSYFKELFLKQFEFAVKNYFG